MNDVKDILGYGLWTLGHGSWTLGHGSWVLPIVMSCMMSKTLMHMGHGSWVMGHGVWSWFWVMDNLGQVIYFYLIVYMKMYLVVLTK